MTVRQRLEMHRANPTCFACHGFMDPLGMALENFNTVGQYREFDPDTRGQIDTTGVLPDGTPIQSAADLTAALMARTDMVVQSLTMNLMTYALGREVDYRDMPTVRRIVDAAAAEDNRFESILTEIVSSNAFQMRESSEETSAAKQASL